MICIPSMLSSFITNKRTFKGVVSSVTSAATSLVSTVVQNQIATTGNIVSQAARKQAQLIRDLFSINADVLSFLRVQNSKLSETIQYVKQQENCAYSASNLLSCVLISATNIQQKLRRPKNEVEKFNSELTNTLTAPAGIVDGYAAKQLSSIDKVKKSIMLQNV